MGLSVAGLYSSLPVQQEEAQGRRMVEAPAWLYSGHETEIKEIAMVTLERCVGSRSVMNINYIKGFRTWGSCNNS